MLWWLLGGIGIGVILGAVCLYAFVAATFMGGIGRGLGW